MDYDAHDINFTVHIYKLKTPEFQKINRSKL